MVMLNGKSYAPSSYVRSPHFTRMEKTARATFSDGDHYPLTKEVRLLLTLCFVSIVVTSYRSSIPLCSIRRTRRKTSGMSWRSGCLLTTSFSMVAWWCSARTNWIIVRRTCLLTMLPCTTSSTLVLGIWMLPTSCGMRRHVP